jgi:hypothetical protein
MEDQPIGAARFQNDEHGYYNQTNLEDALSAAQKCKVLLIHPHLMTASQRSPTFAKTCELTYLNTHT